EVKESEEDSLVYFAKRFDMFREKVNTLLERIATSENKGSFLMKVLHMKEQVGNYDALGHFEEIYHILSQAEEEINETIKQNREKNLSLKIGLIQEAEALQESVEWKETSDKMKDLRATWIKTGPVEKDLTDEIEERFKAALEGFFERKKSFFNDKKQMQNRTYDRYKELIARSVALQNSDDWEVTTAKLKELQNQWKLIGGSLPRATTNRLWTDFRRAHNHFFERLKVKITNEKTESKDKYYETNLEKKQDLVSQAEQLLQQNNLNDAVRRAKELQAEWKKVGPVRPDISDAVWERFIKACDRVFEMSSLEHYIRKRQQSSNETYSDEDGLHARINALKDFIKSDKLELEVLESNLGKLSDTPSNDAFRSMLQGKIRNFNRKIKTKNDLIQMFQEQLSTSSK
ncbi:ribonuclease, partial [Pontibacter sp. HJ8]